MTAPAATARLASQALAGTKTGGKGQLRFGRQLVLQLVCIAIATSHAFAADNQHDTVVVVR